MSISELGAVSLWRLREQIEFGTVKEVEQSNGFSPKKFVPDFKVQAAKYRISQHMLLSISGLDIEKDKVFAIRHKNNRDLSDYMARWNGQLYNVTEFLPDDSKIMTYDLVTLRRSDKNG